MPVHRHPVAVSQAPGALAGIPLDRDLSGRLRASFGLLRSEGTRLGEVFYEKLFAAAPQVRGMFRTEPRAQSAKLLASLEAIVRNLENPAANEAMISEMGRRHVGYGARPEHYPLVVGLLVESIAEVLGPRGEARTLEEWRTALELVSRQMLAGGGGGARGPHAGGGPGRG